MIHPFPVLWKIDLYLDLFTVGHAALETIRSLQDSMHVVAVGVTQRQAHLAIDHVVGQIRTKPHFRNRLDQLQRELAVWRDLLNVEEPPEDEEHPLLAALDETIDARLEWEAQVKLKQWTDPSEAPEAESSGGLMRQMFFGNMFGRKAPKARDEK